jgi:serine/threonine protein kinase
VTFGRYHVVDRIREDETGEVYSAIDQAMSRRVAIKVFALSSEAADERRGRFYREAKIGSQLTHPNAITVLDLAEENGRPYIVMEPLRGVPIDRWLEAPGAVGDAVIDAKIEVMLQICDVLQAAHDRGITHGGLKPSSIFVQHDGGVKVLDFGTGALAAPHPYQSPEQLTGHQPDAHSDVFSAGALFYLIVKGRPPFAGIDEGSLRSSVLHTEPAAITSSEAPESLSRTIFKALSKDPAGRHQSAALLRAEVEQVRRLKDGQRSRTVWAALDRYKRIEGLIGERRALGRRQHVDGIDQSCDAAAARLAVRFPAFARSGGDEALLPDLTIEQATADLTQLQQWHNDELAAVAALRGVEGGAEGHGFLDRASGFFKRWRPDSDNLEGSK